MEMTIQIPRLYWQNNSNNGWSCHNDNDSKPNDRATLGNLQKGAGRQSSTSESRRMQIRMDFKVFCFVL